MPNKLLVSFLTNYLYSCSLHLFLSPAIFVLSLVNVFIHLFSSKVEHLKGSNQYQALIVCLNWITTL